MNRCWPFALACATRVGIAASPLAYSASSGVPTRHALDRSAVYGRYEVYFQLASVQALQLDPEVRAQLGVVNATCERDTSSPNQAELYEMHGVHDSNDSYQVFNMEQIDLIRRSPYCLPC